MAARDSYITLKQSNIMRAEQIRSEFDKLALSEKLLLVEELWDSIAASNAELTLPKWQKEELDRRYKEYQQGNIELHDWQSVHEELREK
jgi:putative addiction module component (TIGR02574 family)